MKAATKSSWDSSMINNMEIGLKDDIVTSLKGIFSSFEFISRVILYGSRAKGNYRPGSDIDLSLVGDQLTINDLNQVSLAIDNLKLPWKADLSIYHQIDNDDLIEHIKRAGIIFYEKELDVIKTGLKPVVYNNSKILILGSFPSDQSLKTAEYYANPANKFWGLLFSIFNQPYSEKYKDRINLLKENHISLWDVIEQCEREGSQDNNIKKEKPNNLTDFLINHPNIKHIFFTGNKAFKTYKKSMPFKLPYSILTSSSALNTSKTYSEKLENWSVVKKHIDGYQN
jgi:hypoxanthine-DNA glycosylase